MLLRAQTAIYQGKANDAIRDVCIALNQGVHPSEESGLPILLAATDHACGYAWGEAEARHRLGEARLLQAAQRLGRTEFTPARFDALPGDVKQLIRDARQQLEQCRELRCRIQDPKLADTARVLEWLNGGVLTTYPLPSVRGKLPVDTAPTSVPTQRDHAPDAPLAKRFRVALSYPGEQRDFVAGVADRLVETLGQAKVFYDQFYEAELARPNLDTYLQHIYQHDSELLVVFLCDDYERKKWTGLESRAIRNVIMEKKDDTIMPIRLDDADVSGWFSIDGCLKVNNRSPEDIAALIIQWLSINALGDTTL